MSSTKLRHLADTISPHANTKSIHVSLTKQGLSLFEEDKTAVLYQLESDYAGSTNQPWRSQPKYFKLVLISTVALVKMSAHAKLGGSIEIMGMLTGKILRDTFVVMDVYSLPVEGTETRVNAQNEAYEYMVQYLDLQKSVNSKDSIVGWYHSHPGYGCWLSGIDVATQSLNQKFQDPYLAIVIDPIQTRNQGKIEIGAFRAYPAGYRASESEQGGRRGSRESVLDAKNMGIHSDQYYSLDINLFKIPQDEEIIDSILNKTWLMGLLQTRGSQEDYSLKIHHKLEDVVKCMQDTLASDDLKVNNRFISFFERHVQQATQQQSIAEEQEDRLESMAGRPHRRLTFRSCDTFNAGGLKLNAGSDIANFDFKGTEKELEFEEDECDEDPDDIDLDYDDLRNDQMEHKSEISADDYDISPSYSGTDVRESALLSSSFVNGVNLGGNDVEKAEDSSRMRSIVSAIRGELEDKDVPVQDEERNLGRLNQGTKRNVRTSSEDLKTGHTFEANLNQIRKRFATGGESDEYGALDAKHKLQSSRNELLQLKRGLATLAHAELLDLATRRRQQAVFETKN